MESLLSLYKPEDRKLLEQLEKDVEELERILSTENEDYSTDIALFILGVPDKMWIK